MNVYLIIEDGESCCIRAKSMSEAVMICENSYIEDLLEEDRDRAEDGERKYYHDEILHSCALVAVLKN